MGRGPWTSLPEDKCERPMIDLTVYLTYVAACIAVVIVPGPTVTVIIANSLRHGASAGLANVVGTQLGLAVMLALLAVGLATVVAHMSFIFEIVKWLGAAYLIYLGVQMWRSDGALFDDAEDDGAQAAGAKQRSQNASAARSQGLGTFFWQGVLVILSNPKALVFFGAFIPQFVDPSGDALLQTIVLGATFMVVATVLDAAYAIAAGQAGGMLTRGNVRLVERVSGTCLIGGGIWLALTRKA